MLKAINIINLVSLLLSPFSYSINNANISGVTFGQSIEITDIEFTVGKYTNSSNGTISVPQESYTFTANGVNFRCGAWQDPNNDGNRECAYYVMSGSNGSATSGTFMKTIAHSEAVALSEVISADFGSVNYSYSYRSYLNVHFDDNQTHTGSFQISSYSDQAAYVSDNENVTVINGNVYFYNVANFNLYFDGYATNQSSINPSLDNVTVANLTDYGSSDYLELIYKTAETSQIAAYQYWGLLGGVLNQDNDTYYHHNFKMSNYSDDAAYTVSKSFLVRRGEPTYISFYSNKYLYGNAFPKIYTNTGDTVDAAMTQYTETRGLYYYTFRISVPEAAAFNTIRVELEYNLNSANYVIPAYLGTGIGLSDDQKSAYGINNDIVQPAVTAADAANDSFSSAASDLIEQENSWNTQMNQSINNIDFNGQVTSNASFLASASFLVTLFNNMVTGNPFGYFIIFFCIVCIAKILIGRKKK